MGKFHGVIRPHTPTGTRMDMANLSASSDGAVWGAFGPLYEFFGERVLDIAVQDESARSRAALPGCPKGPPDGSFECEIQVGIVHDDLRILSSHFERHFF